MNKAQAAQWAGREDYNAIKKNATVYGTGAVVPVAGAVSVRSVTAAVSFAVALASSLVMALIW